MARATTTKRRDRSGTQRGEGKRSRSRDAKNPTQGSRRPTLAREGSSNNAGSRSEDTLPTLKQLRPSSPPTGGNQPQQMQSSSYQSPETLPAAQPPLSNPAPINEGHRGKDSLSSNGSIPQSLAPNPSSDSTIEAQHDASLSAFDFGNSVSNKAEFNSVDPRQNERARADTEPTYRAKRPPPLLNNQEIHPLTKSPTAPQPSPSGSFLGRLFNRRPSQSSTRREFVRQALSDEPDSNGVQSPGLSVFSPGSDRSFFTAEPSPLAPSPLRSPNPHPSHEESLKALEGIPPPSTASTPPAVVVQPTEYPVAESPEPLSPSFPADKSPDPSETFESAKSPQPESSKPFDLSTSPQGAELIEALRRVSIDSASSYGSVGFSERTTSSRSTAPHVDAPAIEPLTSADSTLTNPIDVDMPAPLRPKLPEISPDSPTDPLFQEGRLSPIPDITHRVQDSIDSLPSIHVELREGSAPTPEPATEPVPSTNNPSKPRVPNKGTCRGCSKLILAGQKSVSSADGRLTGRYHKECFVCYTCKTSFPTAEFYVHQDHPYCAHHYHELENSLCATCGKGIEGLYMETTNVAGRGKEKHHPECLKCTTCKVRLDHDYFELSGKVYCERDAFRQATLPKSHDNAPSRPSPLVREYISSGDPGLMVKGRNFPERRMTKLMNMI